MLRRLPDMHLMGESLARRSMTPLRQGEAATDQYWLAGGRSYGALLFCLSPGYVSGTQYMSQSDIKHSPDHTWFST